MDLDGVQAEAVRAALQVEVNLAEESDNDDRWNAFSPSGGGLDLQSCGGCAG